MFSIGVDFHKAYSHITVLDEHGNVLRAGRVGNSPDAIRSFVAPFRKEGRAVVEATRNWPVVHDVLEEELEAVYLAHPLKVRAIAEARIKTDRIDSRILAHLLRCDLVPTAYARPREQRVVQQVLRQRMFVVRLRTMVKNRIHSLVDGQAPAVREAGNRFTDLVGAAGSAWLQTVELPEIERRLLDGELALLGALRERIAQSDVLVRHLAAGDARVRYLRTIPGVGPFFSVLIAHEIGDSRRFARPEKLSAYTGLVPSVHASGGKIFHGRLTKQGNKWLRWAMIEAVRPAGRIDPEIRAHYERVRQRKGPNPAKRQRLGACSRSCIVFSRSSDRIDDPPRRRSGYHLGPPSEAPNGTGTRVRVPKKG